MFRIGPMARVANRMRCNRHSGQGNSCSTNCAANAAASTSATAYRLIAFRVMARVWVMCRSERQFQRIGRVMQIGRDACDHDYGEQPERQWPRTTPGGQHCDGDGEK